MIKETFRLLKDECIKRAKVHIMVSVNSDYNYISKIVDDPKLKPWFFVECQRYPGTTGTLEVITRDGDSYYEVDWTFSNLSMSESIFCRIVGPTKMYFSSEEQPIIRKAIQEYVDRLSE